MDEKVDFKERRCLNTLLLVDPTSKNVPLEKGAFLCEVTQYNDIFHKLIWTNLTFHLR